MDIEKLKKKAERMGRWLNRLSKISPKTAGRLAFRLFCTPMSGRLREKDREFLATAHTKMLETGGQTIATYEWGNPENPLVIFVHGWESNAVRWRYFIHEGIKNGWRVVAFDAPAQGASSGRQLNLPLFMNALATVSTHFGAAEAIVGHSLGGAAIMQALAKTAMPHPKKAVIIASFEHTTDVFRNFQQFFGLNERLLQELNNEVLRISGQPVEAFSNSLSVKNLGHVRALFLHDTDDKTIPVQDGRNNSAAWPGAIFTETNGLGHRMQHGSVVKTIFKFLAEGQ